MGVAEYIKTGISSKAYNKIDYAVNNCCFTTWKYIYPDNYLTMKKELQQLSNNPERHKNHISKTFAIQYQGKWIGITMAYLTHIQYEAKPFNQNITPYTAEGRMLYSRYRKNARKIPLDRPMLANSKDIKLSLYAKDKYNFEYFMNREYHAQLRLDCLKILRLSYLGHRFAQSHALIGLVLNYFESPKVVPAYHFSKCTIYKKKWFKSIAN